MTAKRDLKKRIRDRQAKTGESYTTARRHVLAARDESEKEGEEIEKAAKVETVEPATQEEATNPGAAKAPDRAAHLEFVDLTSRAIGEPSPLTGELIAELSAEPSERFAEELSKNAGIPEPIQVDEVIDVSNVASELGLACKVLVYERLAKAVDPRLAILAIRDALAATEHDPATHVIRAVVTGKAQKGSVASPEVVLRDSEFMAKIAAGLTAVSKDGRMIALHVNGYAGMVTLVCAVWRKTRTLIITTPDDRIGPVVAGLGAGESLFLVYEGRRYKIGREPFVIGRHPTCDLQIKDGYISRKHCAIVQRHGTYYILDLGSHAGIDYRGMQISNKRIEEGDLFLVRDYALRFTFHETDA